MILFDRLLYKFPGYTSIINVRNFSLAESLVIARISIHLDFFWQCQNISKTAKNAHNFEATESLTPTKAWIWPLIF